MNSLSSVSIFNIWRNWSQKVFGGATGPPHVLWQPYLLESLEVLQGLLGSQSQAGMRPRSELADAILEAWVQQRAAQQKLHLLLRHHRLQEAQGVEAHLPVSVSKKKKEKKKKNKNTRNIKLSIVTHFPITSS